MSLDLQPKVLRILRMRKGLSQEELGALVGRSQRTISRWENGTRNTNPELEQRLFEALGFPQEEILRTYLEVVHQALDPDGAVSSLERAAVILKKLSSHQREQVVMNLKNQLRSLKDAHEAVDRAAWDFICGLRAMTDDDSGQSE